MLDDRTIGGTPKSVEPSADLRVMSAFLYQLYVALLERGFTDAQALTLVCHMLEVVVRDGDNTER